MATSSSARRVNDSNSYTKVSAVSGKIEDPGKSFSKSTQRNGKRQDRAALIDVTNDSPIVGLATGTAETPSSGIAKQRGSRVKNTPGSGEDLLRGQVKTLLQKVEEETELSKILLESRPFLQLVNSPVGLLAPTPANTPQILNLPGGGNGFVINSTDFHSVMPSPIAEEQLIPQVVNHAKDKENPESEKSQVTRSLLLDFSEKFETSESSECSPELTFHEVAQESSSCKNKLSSSIQDDNASIRSVQVNASTHDEDEEDIAEEEEYYDDIEEEEEEYDEGLLDELCDGINSISVNEKVAPKFGGKHTIFVYNSDDELVDEEEEKEDIGCLCFTKHGTFEGLANSMGKAPAIS